MNKKSFNFNALVWKGLVWQSLISTLIFCDCPSLKVFGFTSSLSGFEHLRI